MGISYANVDLLLEDLDLDLAKFLNTVQPLEDLRPFAPHSQYLSSSRPQSRSADSKASVNLGIPNYPPPPPPRLNCLYWPTGASRYAVFYGLVHTHQRDQIIQNINDAVEDHADEIANDDDDENDDEVTGIGLNSYTPQTLHLIDDDSRQQISPKMYLLPFRPISAEDPPPEVDDPPPDDRLWLMTLVDERYYWQYRQSSIDERLVNAISWKGLMSLVADDIGFEFENVDDDFEVDTHYHLPDPVELGRPYENAAVLLDSIAHSIGMRIVRDVNNKVYILDWTKSKERLSNASDGVNFGTAVGAYATLAGRDFNFECSEFLYPEKVQVLFRKLSNYRTFPDGELWAVDVTAEDEGDSLYGKMLGMTKVIYTSAYADFTDQEFLKEDELTIGPDLANCQVLAFKIAEDFYASCERRHDYSFASIFDWRFTGYDNYAEWHFGRVVKNEVRGIDAERESPGRYEAYTRVQSMPYDFGVEEMQHAIEGKHVVGPFQRGRLVTDLRSGCFATFGIEKLNYHKQEINIRSASTGGILLGFKGTYTTAISLPATASAIQSALNGLSTINADGGSVIVTGGPLPTAKVIVEFSGSVFTEASKIPLLKWLSATPGGVFGVSIVPTWTPSGEEISVLEAIGIADTNDIQSLILTGNPSSGTGTLTVGAGTTSSVPWNATASQIGTAIMALSGYGPGTISATGGPWPNSEILIEGQGALVNQSLPLIVINGLTGTVTRKQAAGGVGIGGPGFVTHNSDQMMWLYTAGPCDTSGG